MCVNNMPNLESANRKKCVVITVVVGIVVVVALALGLDLALRDGAPKTDHLLSRIDCYPEARWGRGVIDRRDCEERGCEYDPSPRAIDVEAPVCFVSAQSVLGAGYSPNSVNEREDGFTASLRTNAPAKSDVTIQPINGVFEVEYAGENILHLKARAITITIIIH